MVINDIKKICVKIKTLEVDGQIVLLDDNDDLTPEGKTETYEFWFKIPRWGETRQIMSASSSFRDGQLVMDPYVFMDTKVKTLLVDWNLEDDKGKRLLLSESNIERLPAEIVQRLSRELDANEQVSRALGQ